MTLDEAIIHCEEVADRCDVTDGNIKCANEHRQLAEWLKDYKRLLKESEEQNAKNIAIAFQFGLAMGFTEKCDECDDCISRQVVKDKYKEKLTHSLTDNDRGIDLSKYAKEPYKAFCKFIDSIPPVTSQSKESEEKVNGRYRVGN